ncbi:DUF2510 domain-containing protein [Leucobacter komagatae]|uniref:DUF2510 domain-containing protein n=1 Tax=Leucobacter komagatae TaxID=55969 RepID=A0A0D0IPS1_9MICO|nr:DUF2510 domain-containing protein [Leucobacter komagatae]KIP51488.1 hypothetical protein SD72_15145 [Leucobacter komagatae]
MFGGMNGTLVLVLVLATVLFLAIVVSAVVLGVRNRRAHRADAGFKPEAGWYLDPADETLQRYWDGSAWTEHVEPATPETEMPR